MSPSICLAILLLALVSPSLASASINDNNGVTVAAPRVPVAFQFLQGHNDARREVGVAPLEWNWMLGQDAKRYAAQLAARCKLEPPNGKQEGAAATGSWVYERRWYDHGANACAPGKECGSYKLVVRNTTRELGCACRTCRGSNDTVAVCSYSPGGNYDDPPY
ncbi:pathogenesis-related protein PRMS-like [Triticum dicoccoides]|uniref:pathogenesis-related protein PRMS-like n=1 Tax=Triticum dicoccoides TaxID=85692 RepID=UPI00189094F7|nr:pathogenesis-related protein PRMS-like [Triticum dicoccoides]XP_044453727.1 pathogenesis-related protein PRMS-like [Triticum aestivum]